MLKEKSDKAGQEASSQEELDELHSCLQKAVTYLPDLQTLAKQASALAHAKQCGELRRALSEACSTVTESASSDVGAEDIEAMQKAWKAASPLLSELRGDQGFTKAMQECILPCAKVAVSNMQTSATHAVALIEVATEITKDMASRPSAKERL